MSTNLLCNSTESNNHLSNATVIQGKSFSVYQLVKAEATADLSNSVFVCTKDKTYQGARSFDQNHQYLGAEAVLWQNQVSGVFDDFKNLSKITQEPRDSQNMHP